MTGYHVIRNYAQAVSCCDITSSGNKGLSRCRSQVCASTCSIGRPFQSLSDARTRLPRMPVHASVDTRLCICRTPVPVCIGRPFMHLWTPVCAFVGRPYPYPCVRALGGNFIMMRTVPCVQRCSCGTDCRRSNICRASGCCEEPRGRSHELAAAGCAVYESVGGVSRGHAGGSQVTPALSGPQDYQRTG